MGNGPQQAGPSSDGTQDSSLHDNYATIVVIETHLYEFMCICAINQAERVEAATSAAAELQKRGALVAELRSEIEQLRDNAVSERDRWGCLATVLAPKPEPIILLP
jgi:hypothetical protein